MQEETKVLISVPNDTLAKAAAYGKNLTIQASRASVLRGVLIEGVELLDVDGGKSVGGKGTYTGVAVNGADIMPH
jgi:hypothetical protein